jgi:hypothetical protein
MDRPPYVVASAVNLGEGDPAGRDGGSQEERFDRIAERPSASRKS